MTLEELKTAITKRKLRTFDYMRGFLGLSREELSNAGYRDKTVDEAITMVLADEVVAIEKLILKWEKENPDEN